NNGFFAYLGRAAGTMGDANTFGVVAAIWGPALIARETALGRRPPWWTMVGLMALSWVGLWASGSRTAFVAGIIVLMFTLWNMARGARQQVAGSWRHVAVIVVALAALVGVASAARLPAVGAPRRRHPSLPG